MRASVVAVAAVVGLFAGGARAQVAVSAAIGADDVAQRDIAAAVVKSARAQWQMLSPPVGHDEFKSCKPGQTACLCQVAKDHKATHLLFVGVAPLGIRDHIVAVQLFDVTKPEAALFEESVVQPGTDPDGKQIAELTKHLLQHPEPPAAQPSAPVVTPTPPTATPTLTYVGAGVIGGGAAVGVATFVTAALLQSNKNPAGAGYASLIGIAAAGTLMTAGSVMMCVAAF